MNVWVWWISAALAQSPEAVDSLAAGLERSVVTLEVLDIRGQLVGNGTGFAVRADGLIATNAHVAEDAPRRAVFGDGRTLDVLGLVVQDEAHDLALLRVDGTLDAPLKVAAASPSVGAKVIVLGSPHGLASTRTVGEVTAVRPEGMPESLVSRGAVATDAIQVTAQFSPGSSGSPVVRAEDGLVVGVAQSAIPGEALFIAVDGAALGALLDGVPEDAPYTAFPNPHRDVWMAGGVVFLLLGVAAGPSVAGRLRRRVTPRRSSAKGR